jgi:phenylacetate-coenzyme A ligase PaaK-like adenylate-forming protein
MLPGPCPCGGPLPLLGRVEGRRDQAIPVPGGVLTQALLDDLVYAQPGVRGFTTALGRDGDISRLELTVDAEQPLDPEAIQASLPRGLALSLRHAALDPFANRGKRRIRIIG